MKSMSRLPCVRYMRLQRVELRCFLVLPLVEG